MTERLRPDERARYEMAADVKSALKDSRNWKDFSNNLKSYGIKAEIKFRSGTNIPQGISFTRNGTTFKGSSLDRSLSFSRIDKVLTGGMNIDTSTPNVVISSIKTPIIELVLSNTLITPMRSVLPSPKIGFKLPSVSNEAFGALVESFSPFVEHGLGDSGTAVAPAKAKLSLLSVHAALTGTKCASCVQSSHLLFSIDRPL